MDSVHHNSLLLVVVVAMLSTTTAVHVRQALVQIVEGNGEPAVLSAKSHDPEGQCTIAGNCSSHASSVSGNATTGCVCTCENMWVGSTCSTCPKNYDALQNCASCASGYGDYPNCYAICTIADCDFHAIEVSGYVETGCVCVCRNMWEGATCGYCAPNYNAKMDCGACAPGYSNYPTCGKIGNHKESVAVAN